MLIRLKKTRDGVVLTCIRAQGVAVQRTGHGGFFAFHDLMHYAAESTLGLRLAFFGLLAEGWDFETFTDKTDPRYHSLPQEAVYAERIVGCLSRRCSETAWKEPDLLPLFAEEVNRELATPGQPALQPDQVAEILHRFDALAAQWAEIPIGSHLELEFNPGA